MSSTARAPPCPIPPAPGWSSPRRTARASRCTQMAPSAPYRTRKANGARSSTASAIESTARPRAPCSSPAPMRRPTIRIGNSASLPEERKMGRHLDHAWLAAAALAACIGATAARADDDCTGRGSLRLVNGKIHTMDKQDTVVSTVLIKNGRFAAVGHGGQPDDSECAQTINLGGRTVVPGIIDSHNHIILLGLRPGRDTRLENANSIAEAVATLVARAKEAQPGEWITSIGGFSRNQFFPGTQPTTRFPTL